MRGEPSFSVSHWHAVYDSALGPSAKPLALTQFPPRRELIPLI
jgi:hypothetical protein